VIRPAPTSVGTVDADAAQAAALYRQGCDGGNALGCTNLGFLYVTGTGVQADARRRQRCTVRAAALFSLLYQTGTGVATRRRRALYRQGCDGGHATGCTNLGFLYRERDGR
jgi:TPR repeat protein